MTEFFTEQYDVLVTYGPFVTILGFFGFYGIMIYLVHKIGQGTVFNRISFSLLFMALLPNFFAHLSLAIVHGAWSPFLAEVVNIAPVIYYITANEYYYRKHDGMTRAEYNALMDEIAERVQRIIDGEEELLTLDELWESLERDDRINVK